MTLRVLPTSAGTTCLMSTCTASTMRLRKSFSGVPCRGLYDSRAAPSKVAFRVRAVKSDSDASEKAQEVIDALKTRWEKVEDKPTTILYGTGALVVLWFSTTIASATDSIPLLPKLLELVGFGYTTYFVYRYLLFTSNRQELLQKVKEITARITGEDLSSINDEVSKEANAAASDISSAKASVTSAYTAEKEKVTSR